MSDRYQNPYKLTLKLLPWRRKRIGSDAAPHSYAHLCPSGWEYGIVDSAGKPVVVVELRRHRQDRRWELATTPTACPWPPSHPTLAEARDAAEEWVWDYFSRGSFVIDVVGKDGRQLWRPPAPKHRRLEHSYLSRTWRDIAAVPEPKKFSGGISADD